MSGTDQDVAEVLVAIARVEVKLDQALSVGADHEVRLRSLERWRWTLAGAGALAGAVAGSVGGLLAGGVAR